jgi:hypothetical protein
MFTEAGAEFERGLMDEMGKSIMLPPLQQQVVQLGCFFVSPDSEK